MGFFLVIDATGEVAQVVERAVIGAGVSVFAVTNIAAAKRKLIEAAPLMLVSRVTFSDDVDGGYRLGHELKSHEVLSSIPLVLVDTDISEETLRKATECGAKALVPWPVSAESLAIRIGALLPGLKLDEVAAAVVVKAPEAPEPSPAVRPSTGMPSGQAAVAARTVVQSEKLQLAQQLLARVLHSLRTSDLLEVADLEDVPAIVFQMTRTVCGMKDELRSSAPVQSAAPASTGDMAVDLESAFRIKK